jgi:hypothetical protein
MQQLGQRLQREGSEQGQVAERIATLSQYLQRLQQELRERALLSSDTGAMATHDVLRSGKSVKQELRDILTMLQNEALPRETAAMAEQSVLRLSRQLGQNPQLENLLQNLRAGDLDAARQLLRDVLQRGRLQSGTSTGRAGLEYSSRSLQRGGQGDPSTGVLGPRRALRAGPMEMGKMVCSRTYAGMEDFAPGSERVLALRRRRQQNDLALRVRSTT